jgi:spore maturation protein CgeB
MKILLVGTGQSYHIGSFFERALTQLEISHQFLDEWRYFRGLTDSIHQKLWRKIFHRPINYFKFNYDLLQRNRLFRPDVIIITQGLYVRPNILRKIKLTQNPVLINYATDDPFNSAISTTDLTACIPIYDFYACTKRRIIQDIKNCGCKSVEFIPFGFDPAEHYFHALKDKSDHIQFSSEILFIGGADKDRIPIIRKIMQELNINLHLYGIYWNRDKFLKKYYHGFAYNENFRKAHSGTKIGLCLVRKANRDGHSMRSFEIPACGTFLLAERTEEHQEFFTENRDAVFFKDSLELIDKIYYYLKHESFRKKISESGQTRIINGSNTYKDRVSRILEFIQ